MRQLHTSSAAEGTRETTHTAPRLAKPPLVLVVDDEPVHRELHCMMLERAGYATCTADNALEALATFLDRRPALVMTDLRMPGLNGVRMVELLREEDAGARTPVVMVTSSARELDSDFADDTGLFALLPKPVEMVDLLITVADAVGPGCAAA